MSLGNKLRCKAERYVMNELYNLEQTAIEGYATYNFPKGLHLSHDLFLTNR